MTDQPQSERVKAGSLLAILRFLGKYPRRVTLCLGLLLLAIGIELTLPQVIGNAINAVRRAVESGAPFSPWPYVTLLLSLVVLRSIVSYFVGTIRNRITQPTLGDIRSAIYNSLQRLASNIMIRPPRAN